MKLLRVRRRIARLLVRIAAALASVSCSASWVPDFLRDPKGPVVCAPSNCAGECVAGVCGAPTNTEEQHPFGAAKPPPDAG